MRNKTFSNLFFLPALLAITFCLSGCFLFSEYYKNPRTGEWEKSSTPPPIALKPFGYKKLRKKTIHLPGDLVIAMRKYRVGKNTFPAYMALFSDYSRESVEAMKSSESAGFTDLIIEYWSLDSCSISWEHPRRYNQAPTRKNKNIEASGLFIFTYWDSSFYSQILFK